MPRKIEVENLGPVKRLEIELPEPGGVAILKGTNGSGKSTIIDGVARLMGGGRDSTLSATDGARLGSVTIGDAQLRVTRAKSRAVGELEIVGIESRLDIAALVDPGIADQEAADAKRLKALVSLAGVDGRPELFHALAGGEEPYKALGVDDKTPDVLLLAARVKRSIEAEARRLEKIADDNAKAAEQARARVGEIDISQPVDETELADGYARAKAQVDGMIQHNAAADAAAKSAKIAAEQLAALAADSDDAEALDMQAKSNIERANRLRADIPGLELNIQKLRDDANTLIAEADQLIKRRGAAERAYAKREELRQAAERAVPGQHTPPAIAAAQDAAAEARKAISTGAAVRIAQAEALKAEEYKKTAAGVARTARGWRDKAAAVDAVLSGLLPGGCPLRYEAGRLVCETDRSKSEPFSDLSHGERWKLAIEFAADQLGENGLLTIAQEAWESQAPANKKLIADLARERGIVILTAQVSDEALTAEVFPVK